MSNDTDGVIVTPVKDVMLVSELAQASLDRLIRSEFSIAHPKKLLQQNKDFKPCDLRLHPASGTVSFYFTFRGKQRTMRMHFDCDCDHPDLGEQSLTVTLEASGEAEILIRTVLHALSALGPAFIDLDDCDETGFEPLGEAAPTLLDLIHFKYLPCWRLEDWMRLYDRVRLAKGFKEFFGLEREQLVQLLKETPIDDRGRCFEALAARTPPPAPAFMLEYHQCLAD